MTSHRINKPIYVRCYSIKRVVMIKLFGLKKKTKKKQQFLKIRVSFAVQYIYAVYVFAFDAIIQEK